MAVVVVYGGGFQPFHAGHLSSYVEAKRAFPDAEFFVAASNDVKQRPIPFKVKKFLAQQAGVRDAFVEVRQPLNPKEILEIFDPAKDIFVLVRSERDPMPYTKKDGSPAYFQPFVSLDQCNPYGKNAYVLVTKKKDFTVNGQEVYSGSQVRDMYTNADDVNKEQIISQLYPKSSHKDTIKQVLDQYLQSTPKTVLEPKVPAAKQLKNKKLAEMIKQARPLLKEASIEKKVKFLKLLKDYAILFKFAKMWYNGNEATQQSVEQTLASVKPIGYEIGEIESEEGGAFVVQSGDENGRTYIGWSKAQLTGKLEEVDRRGFLKGLGAAAAAGTTLAAPFKHGEYRDQMSGENKGKSAKVISDNKKAVLEIEYDSKQPKVIIEVPSKIINFRGQSAGARIKLGNGPVINTYLNQGTSGNYSWGGILDKKIVSQILRHSGELKFEVDLYKEGATLFQFTIEQDAITKQFAKSDDVEKEKERKALVRTNLEKEKLEIERQRQEQENQIAIQLAAEMNSYKDKIASDIENKIISIIPTVKSRMDIDEFYRFMGDIDAAVEFDITKNGSIENFNVVKNRRVFSPDYTNNNKGFLRDILVNPKLYYNLSSIPDALGKEKISVKIGYIPSRGTLGTSSPQAVVRLISLQESATGNIEQDVEEAFRPTYGQTIKTRNKIAQQANPTRNKFIWKRPNQIRGSYTDQQLISQGFRKSAQNNLWGGTQEMWDRLSPHQVEMTAVARMIEIVE